MGVFVQNEVAHRPPDLGDQPPGLYQDRQNPTTESCLGKNIFFRCRGGPPHPHPES